MIPYNSLQIPHKFSQNSILNTTTIDKIKKIFHEGTPPNTRKSYESDLNYVKSWCMASGFDPNMPYSVDLIAKFIVDHLEGLPDEVENKLIDNGTKRKHGPHGINTINRRVSAISSLHQLMGYPNPCDNKQLSQLLSKSRKKSVRSGWHPHKKAAAPREILEKLIKTCEENTPRDIRDRAILLFGWASGGRRRSEISSATYERLIPMKEEFIYELSITKTSQDGDSGPVPVAGKAAKAMKHWLQYSKIENGPLFRPIDKYGNVTPHELSAKAISRIVKYRAKLAGLDPDKFGGHSLRSGFMTEAGFQGIALAEAMALSKHKSIQIANNYHQSGYGLKNQAARILDE